MTRRGKPFWANQRVPGRAPRRNYIPSSIRREYHHLKLPFENEEENGYQPCMLIVDKKTEAYPLVIRQSQMWTFCDPARNYDALKQSEDDFSRFVNGALAHMEQTVGIIPEPSSRVRAKEDIAEANMAAEIAGRNKIMPMVTLNLVRALIKFGIVVCGDSVVQLFNFIQNGLDDLKDMPPAPYAEDTYRAGEVTLWVGATKISTTDLILTESDLGARIIIP